MAEVKDAYTGVYEYIQAEETNYRTRNIPLSENWDWNMYEHIDRSYTLKNSQYTKGANDFSRPFHNIILPIANVHYRTEGFDVKDVKLYVTNKDNYHKSFLARKYHDKWAIENSIDTAIDESVESYYDYGLTLVKNVNDKRPEVVPLQQIAFCDTTDILSGPICLKHFYSIGQLLEMKGKWDDTAIEMAINNARFSQERVQDRDSETASKYIEVYELHGVFPDEWLDTETLVHDRGNYSDQLHIVTYYIDHETGQKNGMHLYKGKEPERIFKALKRDDIHGRACGRGGIEELFHPQTWTNYSEIHLQQVLEAVSKVVLKSDDPKIAKNNEVRNFKHNQIIHLQEGRDIAQMGLTAPNYDLFLNNYQKWEQNARAVGSASDPQLGINPTYGTPLGTTEIVTSQGQGIHEYRRGKISVFWGEIYRDWVLQYLQNDLAAGDEWIDELSVDELKEVAEMVATKESNRRIKKSILSGKLVSKEEQAQMKQIIKEEFAKGGRQKFIRIMKDEFKNIPLDVKFNIAGKQTYQADMVNKLNSIFRAVFANPQILQDDGMAELFNNILESAGLSPVNFASLTAGSMQQAQQMPQMMEEQPQAQAPQLTSPNGV